MVAASGAFVINDSFFKLATEELPVFQALFLRGVAAAIWCLPMVLLTRSAHRMRMIFDRWALLRNVFEIIAVFCFLNALARMPIADISAIGQLSPMLLLIGAAVIFRERLGRAQIVLILGGFAGALMVAQPQAGSVSPFMVLGLVAAVAIAGRDIVARMLPADIPGPVVAYGAVIMVMAASGIATLLFDSWVSPSFHTLVYLLASGFFLMFGQLFIFLTFRVAPVGVVAPFLYSTLLWALLLGFVMFGDFPNPLAFAGIGLILVCGVILVMRSSRPAVAARTPIDIKQGSGRA